MKMKMTEAVKIIIQRIIGIGLLVLLIAAAVFWGVARHNEIRFKECISMDVTVTAKSGKGRNTRYTFQTADRTRYHVKGRVEHAPSVGDPYEIYRCVSIDNEVYYRLEPVKIYQPVETFGSNSSKAAYTSYRAIAVKVAVVRNTGDGKKYLLKSADGAKYNVSARGKELSLGDGVTIYLLRMKDGSKRIQFERPRQ